MVGSGSAECGPKATPVGGVQATTRSTTSSLCRLTTSGGLRRWGVVQQRQLHRPLRPQQHLMTILHFWQPDHDETAGLPCSCTYRRTCTARIANKNLIFFTTARAQREGLGPARWALIGVFGQSLAQLGAVRSIWPLQLSADARQMWVSFGEAVAKECRSPAQSGWDRPDGPGSSTSASSRKSKAVRKTPTPNSRPFFGGWPGADPPDLLLRGPPRDIVSWGKRQPR